MREERIILTIPAAKNPPDSDISDFSRFCDWLVDRLDSQSFLLLASKKELIHEFCYGVNAIWLHPNQTIIYLC